MTETTILYALSTLAQTCAALAAFVGAVGLYKLQTLRDQRVRAEGTLRGLFATMTNAPEAARLTLDEILRVARINATGPTSVAPAVVENLRKMLREWDSLPRRQERIIRVLFIFEGWHLLVIGAALIGFNYVRQLTTCAGTSLALCVVAVGTVVVTIGSVVAWTRE